MKISYKIKLDPSIMPFAFFFTKSVSIPSDINSNPKIIFDFLRKKQFSKLNIVEEMYAFAKFLREHLSQILFS